MKKSITLLLAISISFASFAQKAKGNTNPQQGATVITTMYTCPMHSEEKSDKEGNCSKCGMGLILSPKEQMKAEVTKSFNCPMHPTQVNDKAGNCPKCGMELKQTILTSNAYACPMHPSVVSDKAGKCAKCQKYLFLSPKEQMKMEVIKAYVCPMHPTQVSDKAGKCPECGMNFTKAKAKFKHNRG